jgi:serine/threonine-protein kinase
VSVIVADRLPVQDGDTLEGKYRIERTIGIGGMAVVAAATHLDLGQTVAIKVMLPAAMERPDAVERFLREGRALANIKSSHVCKVLDVGKLESGEPYLVMEYLHGYDLEVIINKRGALSVEDAVDYILQACSALAEAHALGVVHRDIKPSNLFVVPLKGERAHIKVLDFGISKAPLQLVGGDNNLTQESAVMGSPSFMSPEQMRSARDVDARTDIWSLGIILYQLLTGVEPFPGESVPEIFANVLEKTPKPMSDHVMEGYLPDGLEAIVMRCLEKDPSRRFQSVNELAEALELFGPPPLPKLPKLPTLPIAFDVGPPRPFAKTFVTWEGALPRGGRKRRMLVGSVVLSVGAAAALGVVLFKTTFSKTTTTWPVVQTQMTATAPPAPTQAAPAPTQAAPAPTQAAPAPIQAAPAPTQAPPVPTQATDTTATADPLALAVASPTSVMAASTSVLAAPTSTGTTGSHPSTTPRPRVPAHQGATPAHAATPPTPEPPAPKPVDPAQPPRHRTDW